jgi:hypothetical protein
MARMMREKCPASTDKHALPPLAVAGMDTPCCKRSHELSLQGRSRHLSLRLRRFSLERSS